MSLGAKVDSFETLRAFRAALYKFAETANSALTDAEGETQRVMAWLERDQQSYWQFQLRKRQEEVLKAKEAVRMKKLFKSSDGKPGSAVDEEKALQKAIKRLEAGEQKYKAVMSHSRKMPKEIMLYKGQVQRLLTALSSEVPTAGATLNRLVATLEAYAAISGPAGGPGGDSGKLVTSGIAGELSMSRGGAQTPTGANDWNHLRARTPSGAARGQASSGDPRPLQLRAATIAPAEHEILAAIPVDRLPVDEQARVVLSRDLGAATRVYLERAEVAFPGDSGWYLGRADEVEGQAAGSMSIADLLAERPDLNDLLTLPRGFLVVVDGAGLVEVADAENKSYLRKTAVEQSAAEPSRAEGAPEASEPPAGDGGAES